MGTNARARVTNSAKLLVLRHYWDSAKCDTTCTPNLMFPDPFPDSGES